MNVQYSTLGELEKIAQKEAFSRRGKHAVIENFAKKSGVTVDEAAKGLNAFGKISSKALIKPPISMVGMTSEEFDRLPDDQFFYVSKRMLMKLYEKIRNDRCITE